MLSLIAELETRIEKLEKTMSNIADDVKSILAAVQTPATPIVDFSEVLSAIADLKEFLVPTPVKEEITANTSPSL